MEGLPEARISADPCLDVPLVVLATVVPGHHHRATMVETESAEHLKHLAQLEARHLEIQRQFLDPGRAWSYCSVRHISVNHRME